MKKKRIRMMVVFVVFAMLFMPITGMESYAATQKSTINAPKAAKVKKPAQVKGLKKVKEYCKWDGYRNISYVKIKFNKVKGATGYQVLIYQRAWTQNSLGLCKNYQKNILYHQKPCACC